MWCQIKTKRGHRCRNRARKGHRTCHSHREEIDPKRAFVVSACSAIGHLIAPGIGGIAVGAGAGLLLDRMCVQDEEVVKRRVFVSFDFENDRPLKDFVIGQSMLSGSPFVISDLSLKRAAPEANWENVARLAIRRSDIVIVMVGAQTHRAQGVLKEVAIAREEGIRIAQMIGHKDRSHRAVPGAGRMYRWNWENLRKLLS